MAHPVLTDPGLSVPVTLVMGNSDIEVKTRGVVETDFVDDQGTSLAAPHGMLVRVPDPTPVGTAYSANPVEYVSVPSLRMDRLRVVSVEPSGAAVGSTGIDWRSLSLRVQLNRGDG